MKNALVILLIAGVAAGAAAQTKAPSTRPAGAPVKTKPLPDLCKDAVDPYNAGSERGRFFTAAGKDSELTAAEGEANRKAPKPFVRRFDRWSSMIAFDKNANKTLDWFEADAYRKGFRQRVLLVFDADKNSRLAGKEREQANRALAAGKLPRAKVGKADRPPIWIPAPSRPGQAPPPPRPPRPRKDNDDRPERAEPDDDVRQRMLDRFDADGDGTISPEERQEAFRAMRERAMRDTAERADTDGDGKVSDEERAEMRREQAGPWKEALDEWVKADFDADGDGELNEEETASRKAFEKRLQDFGKEMRLRFDDRDGDGKISDEERQAAREQNRKTGFALMMRAGKYMDTDGDGEVSGEERMRFRKSVSTSMLDWVGSFRARFDGNRDGRLDETERGTLVDGLRGEILKRVEKFDADGDGRINSDEAVRLVEDFGKEIGALKKPDAPEAPEPPAP